MHADPAPARLDAAIAILDRVAVTLGRGIVDPEKTVAVRPGAGATCPRLDAKQVVQQCRHELVVQVFAIRRLDVERDNADAAFRVRVAEDLDAVLVPPALHRACREFVLPAVDRIHADTVLDLEHERRFHRLKYAGRAGFLAFLDILDEVLVGLTDVVNRTAGTDAGWQLAVVNPLVEY